MEWIREYIRTFRFKSISCYEMYNNFINYFPHVKETDFYKNKEFEAFLIRHGFVYYIIK